MVYTPQQALSTLQQKQYAPVYFLQGTEPYYIDLVSSCIEENVLSDAEKSFNLTIVYGKEQSMSELLAHARQFPMGSDYLVIIVKEAQELQDFKREEGRKQLENYLKDPQPTTLLVFAHKYKTLDARTSLSKALAQHAVIVQAKKMYDNQIPAWIAAYVREKGLTITEKATLMLQELAGNDLAKLANELNKIRLNLKEATEIDDAMLQEHVGLSRSFNVFELQKALGKKDALAAHKIVQYFGANPKDNPAIPVVALLFSFFSKLLLLHHAKDKSESALAKALQISPYFVGEYIVAAKYYPLARVVGNIGHLHQADLQLKGVDYPATPEGQILKELICKLMR